MNKKETWRNQTLINRIDSDSDILVEYHTLIQFIKENYTEERYEVIQTPCLHLISHSIELFYKIILERASDYKLIEMDKKEFIHEHDISKLKDYIFTLFDWLAIQNSCSPEDEKYFKSDFKNFHNYLCELLNTKVPTYRYALQRDKKGNKIDSAIPFKRDEESPNMIDVYELYDKAYNSLSYIDSILDYYILDI